LAALVVCWRIRREPGETSGELCDQLLAKLRRPIAAADGSKVQLQSIEPQQRVRTRGAIEDVFELYYGTVPERTGQLLLDRRSLVDGTDLDIENLPLNAMPIRACHWRLHSLSPPWPRARRRLQQRERLE